MKYLVKFRPLEPYTFGTDQTFEYPEQGREGKTGKESYFVLSGTVPAQTTILGALRYLVLKRKGFLRSDFHYPNLEEVRAAIGPESFRFDAESPQNFGAIRRVSPLFLLRSERDGEHTLIRNPFHNRAEKSGYVPMRLTSKAVWTSHGEIFLPDAGEYDAKQGYAGGYIDLDHKTVYPSDRLFRFAMSSGNQKSSGGDERAYYRRQTVRLDSDCAFAAYVEADADALPPESVAYMGQKRAAFRVTAEPSDAQPIETQVREAFADASETPWFYALSPLRVPADAARRAFRIVKEISQRNLATDYSAPTPIHKLKRSSVRYNLIQAGSVFYGEPPALSGDENCRNIGYNSVVQLGGKLS